MTPTTHRQFVKVGLALAVMLSVSPARGDVGSDHAAAMVVYPYVTLSTSQGVDTILQLSNTSTDPVVARCFYESAPTDDPLVPCNGVEVVDFQFELTPQQPIGWRASEGLANFPLDGINQVGPGGAFNQNSLIPPVASDPYVGSLRCVAVDANLVPVERNVLVGTATIGQRRSAADPSLDTAQYNAIGFLAHAGAQNNDETLVLGGENAEYDACPNVAVIPHFFDGAVEPATRASSVSTTLVLVPCSRDLAHLVPSDAVVMYDVYNEFEQHLSTRKALHCQQVSTLSTIDTANPSRSIFSVQVTGTLTGQTHLQTVSGSGILALAIEAHSDLNDPTRTARAAFNAHMIGARAEADTVVIFPSTPSPSASATRTSTATVTAQVATPTPTATTTPTSVRTATPTNTAIRTNTGTAKPTNTPSATAVAPSPTLTAADSGGCAITAGQQPTAVVALALLLGPALALRRWRRATRQ